MANYHNVFSNTVLACSETENSILDNITKDIKSSDTARNSIEFELEPLEPVCKQWPSQKGKSILVKPYSYTVMIGKSQETYLGVTIAVIDLSAKKIINMIDEKQITTKDAIFTDRISVDTAYYKLSQGELAFGVRFAQRNSSSASPLQEEFINLYIPSNKSLTPIIKGLRTYNYSGEGNGNCLFDGVEESTTISIKESTTNKKRDIGTTTKTTQINTELIDNKCKTLNMKPTTTSRTLKFNGSQYETPNDLRSHLSL